MGQAPPSGNESLSDIRVAIDSIDRDLVALIAARQSWVEAAGRAKAKTQTSANAGESVEAPARVQQVVEAVREKAVAAGASADVVEATYRAMIKAFIELERGVHQTETKRQA